MMSMQPAGPPYRQGNARLPDARGVPNDLEAAEKISEADGAWIVNSALLGCVRDSDSM